MYGVVKKHLPCVILSEAHERSEVEESHGITTFYEILRLALLAQDDTFFHTPSRFIVPDLSSPWP